MKGKERYAILDRETGEILELNAKSSTGSSNWLRVFQNGKRELLSRSPELHGQSHRVLNYLDAVVAWGNSLPTPAKVAESLNLKLPNAYRAYTELMKAEIVLKRDGVYYLSPLYCWKGNEKQFEQACQELIKQNTRALGMGWDESVGQAWVGLT